MRCYLLSGAVVLGLITAAAPQGEWQAPEGCEQVEDGVWQWQLGGGKLYLGAEQAGEGIVRLTVGAEKPSLAIAAEVEVGPGTVKVPQLPPVAFEVREGAVRCRLPAEGGECFFGLGEKYNSVNQRGRKVNMWVDDGYRSLGDRTYLPVPMYVSSRHYGLYLDSALRSTFDMASEGSQVVITLDGPTMALYLWSGADYPELLRRYCQITGFPEPLPGWAHGIWLSRSSYASQKEVLEVVRRWRSLDLPLSLLNIEGWKGVPWHAFNERAFPDPRAMIQTLHEYGIKVMLWNTHNLPPDDPHYAYGDEHGYFVKGLDGKTFNVPEGYGRGGCLDVTNPEAVAWWHSLYDPLLDLGVDGLFNDITNYLDDDFGAQRSGRMVFHNGQTSTQMHNLYWLLFNKATYEYMKARTGGDTVLRVAGGWAGQQKYSSVWAGDSATTWEFLERDIKALLSAGWSGIPYFGFDIPGFCPIGNPPSKELYIRYLQLGALAPMMQFHTGARPEPWHYGDEAVAALRSWGWIREAFMPYIQSLALEAAATGAPMARSLAWEYPQDATAVAVEDQFLLGRDLLVAPLYRPGSQRRVYIPAGTWLDILDGSSYVGPTWAEAQSPLDHLPVYIREGAIIPMKLTRDLAIGPSMRESHLKVVEIVPPGGRVRTDQAVLRRKEGDVRLSCTRKQDQVILCGAGRRLPAGTLLRFEVGPPNRVTCDGRELKEIPEKDLVAGDKRGWLYRKSEQVCFVNPSANWETVTLTEQQGQLRFERWSSPTVIPANARTASIEVSIPLLKLGTVPTMAYAYRDATRMTSGRRVGPDRWRFTVPLKLSATAEDLTWSIRAQARTDEFIESRPRVTSVIPPVTLVAPTTVRLADEGRLVLKVVSQSSLPTAGRLELSGPPGLSFSPVIIPYQVAGRGTVREIMVQYRTEPRLRLGEHPITVRHFLGRVALEPATVLGLRPLTWSVAGPFSHEGAPSDWLQAFRAVLPPETGEVDLAASYDTSAGTVTWRPFPQDCIADDGMLDLARLFDKLPLATAYLYASFVSPAGREALLKLGSDDALVVWLNGTRVFEFSGGRVAIRDQDSVAVKLLAGRNTILAKVFNITDAWRLYLRLTDPQGKPVGDLSP